MGQKYGQLSLEERCEIARLQAAGCSRRAIAEALGRDPATIGRELKRNTDRDAGYKPAKAQSKAAQRCWKGAKLDRDDALREEVLAALKRGWSPEQVAGWLGARAGQRVVSHETIYRFIYAQMRRSNDGAWRNYLPRAKARRGRRGKKGGSSVKTFKDRVSINERPACVASRLWPGHWEADLMAFSRMGQNLLLAHERKTRFILLARQTLRQRHRKTGPVAWRPAARPAQDHDLRQWNGVRPPSPAWRGPRREDLLLRSAQPVAERRHRERHRTPAPLPAAQDRSRQPVATRPARRRRPLQRHPTQGPWLEHPRRGILTPPQTVALQM